MGRWAQNILVSLACAALLAGGSAVVTVAVLSSRADANDTRVASVAAKVEILEDSTVALKTDSEWIKDALKRLLDDRGLKAPKE